MSAEEVSEWVDVEVLLPGSLPLLLLLHASLLFCCFYLLFLVFI